MSEAATPTRTERRRLWYAHHRLEAGVCPWPLDRALGGVALFRLFLCHAAYRHSFSVWIEFAVLYAAFVILFLGGKATGRRQTATFMLFFVFSFLYNPLTTNAYAIIAYPFAMLCLFLSVFDPVPGADDDDGGSRR